MNFEKKLSALEALSKKLENKDLSLEDGIALFGDGLNLTKDCLKSLAEAKGQITIIKQEMGKLIEEAE